MDDAARRGARLRVVAALAQPDYWVTPYGPVPLPPSAEELDRVRTAAQQWIDDVIAARPPGAAAVPIDVSAVPGPPAEALIIESRDADLLVLGHRGRGAVASRLLGSVGMRCVLDAPCPVTVVRPQPATVAGSPSARRLRPSPPVVRAAHDGG
jgi:nucleotide-binding universal stress UspA family protein